MEQPTMEQRKPPCPPIRRANSDTGLSLESTTLFSRSSRASPVALPPPIDLPNKQAKKSAFFTDEAAQSPPPLEAEAIKELNYNWLLSADTSSLLLAVGITLLVLVGFFPTIIANNGTILLISGTTVALTGLIGLATNFTWDFFKESSENPRDKIKDFTSINHY